MSIPEDYRMQTIMRTGYAGPPDPYRHALWCDIEDLDAEIRRRESTRDRLNEELECLREERREKYAGFIDL